MANIDELDDDFILCNVCNIEYDEDHRAPKLLPCLHTLCNDCALNASSGSVLRCSLCQREHRLSSDLDFLKDSTMQNMMDVIKLQKKPSSISCSDCPDGNKGEHFCKDCYVFLCQECTNAHRRTQLTRRHTILTLEELKNAGIGSFTRKEMCSLPGHEDQPFSFYCESNDCQKPVCTQCVVNDHSQSNGHAIRNLSEVFEENKLLVERFVGELLTKISGVSSDAKMLEAENETIDTKRFDVNGQIDSLFDSFVAMINARREKLKERVSVICEDRRKLIKEKLEQLQRSKSDMENACNYSSRMLVFTNKPEFLQLKDTVISKLSELAGADINTNKPEGLEIRFEACVDQGRFGDIAQNIGEVRTNIYGDRESVTPKLNGTVEITEDFILPYKGSPKHPPGKYTTNKFTSHISPTRPTREVRVTPSNTEPTDKPSVESLKLDLQNDSKPAVKGLKGSPTSENVLGRPLTLKSPVISTAKQPTSLGDFLNELQSKTRMFLRDRSDDEEDESQTVSTKDLDRQLPKAPNLNPALSPTRKSPGTPPYTPPSYVPQPQMYQTYNLTGNHSSNSGIQSPPTRDVTSYSKNGESPPTANGKTNDNPFIQNSRIDQPRSYIRTNPVVPKLNLKGMHKPSAAQEKNVPNGGLGAVTNSTQSVEADSKQPKAKGKPQNVTWKLDQNVTKDLSPKSPKTPKLTESSYPDVKQPSPRKPATDKLVVFGDIACPDFQMDPASAHHEREVTSDGRTLRNKKTDIYSSPSLDLDLDNSLVQYKGAIGTLPFQEKGKFYYEVDVVYNIQQPLEETWLVFEIGLCRLDDVDMHHTVERHEFARSFYVARYPEDGKLTMEFWHNRDLLNFMPLSDNAAGIEMRITYGFLVDTRSKKWIVVDCNNNKVLHKFDSLDFTEPLYPVFGCYNPDLCTVDMTLKTGSDITMVPQCLKSPGYRSP